MVLEKFSLSYPVLLYKDFALQSQVRLVLEG